MASESLTPFSLEEIRSQAKWFLEAACEQRLRHTSVNLGKLPSAADRTVATLQQAYPDLQLAPYGVWRDFETGSCDRWAVLAGAREFETPEAFLASASDLAFLASFLRLPVRHRYNFQDPISGANLAGVPAIAVAVMTMFASGAFSLEPSDPFRVDAGALSQFDGGDLAGGFQMDQEEDAHLLSEIARRLKLFGEAMALRPDLFELNGATRPGGLVLRACGAGDAVDTPDLADRILQAFAPLWPDGAWTGDLCLGDVFSYGQDAGRLVPFHLAAQEMIYSLMEPLAWSGVSLNALSELSSPSDDVHAALLMQTGVMTIETTGGDLSDVDRTDRMVEIRALTVALTDRIADCVRQRFEADAEQLPLTCILEGGTSRAGRAILAENREQASILGQYLNPGSVFWLPFGA